MNSQKIGQRINAALASSNMKQKDLAKILGVTDNTISYYCSGARTPKVEQLGVIAQVLHVTTDYLLGLTNDPNIQPSAVDELGISEKAVTWIKSLGADNDDADKNIEIFDFLLTNNHFQLFFSELCSLYYARRATKLYRILGDHVENVIGEKIQKMHLDYADQCEIACRFSKQYHAAFDKMVTDSNMPNEIRDYLAAINKLAQMNDADSSYGSAALSDIMNSSAFIISGFDSEAITNIVELHVQKIFSKVLEEIKNHANTNATAIAPQFLPFDIVCNNGNDSIITSNDNQ